MSILELVNVLTGLLIVTSLAVVLTRSVRAAAGLYALQSLVIVGIFVCLGFANGSQELFVWAGTSFITKVVMVPGMILFALKKLGYKDAQNPVGGVRAVVTITVTAFEVLICYLLIQGIELPAAAQVKLPLAISLAHFFIGLTCIVSQRNIFKQIFGYCLMENGSHITLALLASDASGLVEIGVTTDAILAVLIMMLVASRIFRTIGTADANDLTNLKG